MGSAFPCLGRGAGPSYRSSDLFSEGPGHQLVLFYLKLCCAPVTSPLNQNSSVSHHSTRFTAPGGQGWSPILPLLIPGDVARFV